MLVTIINSRFNMNHSLHEIIMEAPDKTKYLGFLVEDNPLAKEINNWIKFGTVLKVDFVVLGKVNMVHEADYVTFNLVIENG